MNKVSHKENCPVCLDVIGEKNYIVTECGHTFHATCIFMNMRVCSTCPLCRTELLPERCESDDDANVVGENDGGDEPVSQNEINNILDNTINELVTILDLTYTHDDYSSDTLGEHTTNNIDSVIENMYQVMRSS
jgi:hypothetical protein